jgi:hypothetical protein
VKTLYIDVLLGKRNRNKSICTDGLCDKYPNSLLRCLMLSYFHRRSRGGLRRDIVAAVTLSEGGA